MIRIQNVYYMLAYAFQVLNEQTYRNLATEEFSNTADLFAAILAKGINSQIKRGLGKAYILEEETLSSVRGKIDISASIKTQALHRKQLTCSFDEFSVDTKMNRIIKATVQLLLKSDIDNARKKELRKLMIFFNEVGDIDLFSVDWHMSYNRNNQTYRMLMGICYLTVKGLLHSHSDGSTRLMNFIDDQRMCRLYEKFILEYYRKEFPCINANASQIPWQLDDEVNDLLPVMQTDIMLSYKEKVLIIDAKYYGHTTQVQYGVHTLHSSNVYQIFTYVKNKEAELAEKPHEVSGLLLYAKTDEDIYPENEYHMSGNRVSVRTLNLDCDFSEIRMQLDSIVSTHFGDREDVHYGIM